MNEIQSRILTIFEQIKNICDENHIPYYAPVSVRSDIRGSFRGTTIWI